MDGNPRDIPGIFATEQKLSRGLNYPPLCEILLTLLHAFYKIIHPGCPRGKTPGASVLHDCASPCAIKDSGCWCFSTCPHKT